MRDLQVLPVAPAGQNQIDLPLAGSAGGINSKLTAESRRRGKTQISA
jgi:hypothetical protein